jgi:dihydrofolate reductase
VNTALQAAVTEKVFIIGGEEIYRQFMAHSHVLYITRVHTRIDGDSFFPEITYDQWKLVDKTTGEKGEKDEFDYSYETYVRK